MNQNNKIRHKGTDAVIESRLNVVTKLYLQGYSRAEIVRYSAVYFKIKTRNADNYILKAKTAIKKIADEEKDYQRCLALARFEDLYKMAYKDGNLAVCQSIQNSINKLMGLNADINVNANVSLKGSISPEKWIITDLISFTK